METNQLYLYGITHNYYDPGQFIELKKLGFQVIQYEKISAIVAEKEYVSLEQTGKETLARLLIDHQKVLESLMEMGFSVLIPMKLGTYSKNKTEVRRILEIGYTLCLEILEKVGNMVEIDIAATWANFSEVLEMVVVDPEVIELREKLMLKGNSISTTDRMQIGKLVKDKLDKKGVQMKQQIVARLGIHCKDVKQHELMNDEMVANVAFLLNKAKIGSFEKTLDQLDKELNGELNFKFVGPLPCYSFYTLEVVELNFAQIELAKNELGLQKQASAKEIKQAYFKKVKLAHPDMNSGDEDKAYFNSVNNAYRTITDYMQMVKQSSTDDLFYFTEKQVNENSMLVKIKE